MTTRKFNFGERLSEFAASPSMALAVIAAFVAVVFGYFLKAPALSDQLDYFSSALMLPDVSPTHRHLRVGLVWPLWGAIQVFGYSEIAYYLMPYLAAVFLGFGTWWLGRLMFTPAVGWVAGIFIVLIPRYVADMSYILPDYLAAGIFTIAVALVFWASMNRTEIKSSRSLLAFAGAGALLGWAYLTREYIVVLFPCMGLALLLLRTPLREWLAFCAGALAFYFLEVIWGWLVYGDPFIRLSAAGGPRETSRPFATDFWQIIAQFPAIFSDLRGGVLVAGLITFGLVSGLAGLLSRHPGWKVIASWSVLGWLFFTLISLLPMWLFDGEAVYLRMHKFRYWALIFPPVFIGAVAGVFALAKFISKGQRAISAMLATALLTVPAYGYLQGLHQVSASGALVRVKNRDYLEFRDFLKRQRDSLPDIFWTDHGTGVSGSNSLPIYFRSWTGSESIWNGELRYLNRGRLQWLDQEDVSTGYVVIDRTRSKFIIDAATPDYFSAPETVWATVFKSSNGRVLVLDPTRTAYIDHSIVVQPDQLQVTEAPNSTDNYTKSLDSDGLFLRVGAGARLLVSDGTGPHLYTPDEGVNTIFGIGAGFVSGYLYLKPENTKASRVRCLYYDSNGGRIALWANVSPLLSSERNDVRHFFSCSLPQDRVPFTSFRIMLELRQGENVGIEKIEYGFSEH